MKWESSTREAWNLKRSCGLRSILALCLMFLLLHGTAVRAESVAVPEPESLPAMTSPLITSHPLIGIATAGTRLVSVGQKGHIVWSDDQGQTWTQARVPVSVDLVAVQFPTPQTGWATGHDGIVLKSNDAGQNWSVVLDGRRAAKLIHDYYKSAQGLTDDPHIAAALKEAELFVKEEGARPILDLWFTDEKNGFIVGAWGLILHTSDGGVSWVPWLHRVDNPNSGHLNAIRPSAGALWVAGESGLLLKLDDTAQRFVKVDSPEGGSLFGLVAVPGGMLAFGLVGRAIVSHDEGKTWATASGLGPSGLTAGTTLSDGRVVLVDIGARAWISRDRGNTFVTLRLDEAMPFAGVTAASAASLALVGLSGVRQQAIAP